MIRPARLGFFAATVAFAALALGLQPARAAGTIAVQYFVLPENHPDVNHGIDGSTIKGLVAKRLGPHGFPVATTFARTKGGPSSGPIHDLNADGEILWWTTASHHHVRSDGTGSEKVPLLVTSLFPRGQQNDTKGFRTGHFHGTFDAATQAASGMQLGSDDDTWVFVDAVLQVDNGGVKAMTYTPYSLGTLSPGTHTMDIFYADRYGSGAAIEIDSPLAMAAAPMGATNLGGGGGGAAKPAGARVAGPSLTAAQMRMQLQKTGRFTLRDIHFAFNKTDISRDSAKVLGEVGKLLTSDPTLRLSIEGHTDNVGTEDYNASLSQRRAAAVKAWLVAHARIANGRLKTAGYGLRRPVASNATAEGQALNRRVEFVKI